MLKPAYFYKDQLNKCRHEAYGNDRFKFLYSINYQRFELSAPEDEWDKRACVSLNTSNKVIGYLRADIDRGSDAITNLSVASFDQTGTNSNIFAADFRRFFSDLQQEFNKVVWSVIIGNPIEKAYDILAKRINARVAGIFKQDIKIYGKYYDSKWYEWLKNP